MKQMRITIKNLQKKIPINPARIKRLALKALSSGRVLRRSGEITVCFMEDKEIRKLNLMYLGASNPTDVIAFDNTADKKELSADIAISAETAIKNARIFKASPASELCRYVIHGILHLSGYDDNNKKNQLIMRAAEERLLSKYGYK